MRCRITAPASIGMGTARPGTHGHPSELHSPPQSGIITEKSPTVTFASLESHKIAASSGYSREIDEQSIVPMGHPRSLRCRGIARSETPGGFSPTAPHHERQKASSRSRAITASPLPSPPPKPNPATPPRRLPRPPAQVVTKPLRARPPAHYLDSTWKPVSRVPHRRLLQRRLEPRSGWARHPDWLPHHLDLTPFSPC